MQTQPTRAQVVAAAAKRANMLLRAYGFTNITARQCWYSSYRVLRANPCIVQHGLAAACQHCAL